MTFRQAKRLHNEDEVIDKVVTRTPGSNTYWPNRVLRVVSTIVDEQRKDVWVLCDNGETYHHRRLL